MKTETSRNDMPEAVRLKREMLRQAECHKESRYATVNRPQKRRGTRCTNRKKKRK